MSKPQSGGACGIGDVFHRLEAKAPTGHEHGAHAVPYPFGIHTYRAHHDVLTGMLRGAY